MIDTFSGYTNATLTYSWNGLTLVSAAASNHNAVIFFTQNGSTNSGYFAIDPSISAAVYDSQGNVISTGAQGQIAVHATQHPSWLIVDGSTAPVPYGFEGIDTDLVTEVTFESVLYGICENNTECFACDLDDSLLNQPAVIRQANGHVAVLDGLNGGRGLAIDWRWGGYGEVDISRQAVQLSDFTVCLWVNINWFDSDYTDNTAYWSIEGSSGDSLALSTSNGSGNPKINLYGSGFGYVPALTSRWAVNGWTMLTLVFDSAAGTVKLYHNISLANTSTGYDATSPTVIERLRIGNTFDSEVRSTKGTFDALRVYKRALTAAEVTAIYNATRPQ